mgnify:FL=1
MGKIAIVGCGAAGAFCGANLREMRPDLGITVFEAGRKPLAKVALTGGGRCNLTNDFSAIGSLAEAYPRGWRLMKRALKEFGPEDTCRWFRERGVRLVLQEDHRWFPASQDAAEIVRTLLRGLQGAEIRTGARIEDVSALLPEFDAVVVTTGGGRDFSLLAPLGLEIVPAVPSLFTLSTDSPIRGLSGTAVTAIVGIAGTRFRAAGSVLITDWGFSGPAVLALSSYSARHLAETGYRGTLLVNWLSLSEEEARERLAGMAVQNSHRQLSTVYPLPSRLWEFILGRCRLDASTRWGQMSPAALNRLASRLVADDYPIAGKSRFREEFVTCGGVALGEIDPATMECRRHPGLYFAGEVLDIDAITGGFNLQAAWTTGYLAARAISRL